MAEGRRLSNDSVERLCEAVRFLRTTGNSYRPTQEKHAARGKRPCHLRDARAMGALIHHPRIPSNSADARGFTRANSALVAAADFGIKAKRWLGRLRWRGYFAAADFGIKAKQHCLIQRIRLRRIRA